MLRQGVRRELGVLESDRDEAVALETVKKELAVYEMSMSAELEPAAPRPFFWSD
jgi:hypothetical protein